MENVLDQTAITYPQCTLNDLTGEAIKAILEDVCDNLFNPDPYLQQGGDMVRVGGLTFTGTPGAKRGGRVSMLSPPRASPVGAWPADASGPGAVSASRRPSVLTYA